MHCNVFFNRAITRSKHSLLLITVTVVNGRRGRLWAGFFILIAVTVVNGRRGGLWAGFCIFYWLSTCHRPAAEQSPFKTVEAHRPARLKHPPVPLSTSSSSAIKFLWLRGKSCAWSNTTCFSWSGARYCLDKYEYFPSPMKDHILGQGSYFHGQEQEPVVDQQK